MYWLLFSLLLPNTWQKRWKEERVCLAHGFRVRSITVGKSWHQECEATGHMYFCHSSQEEDPSTGTELTCYGYLACSGGPLVLPSEAGITSEVPSPPVIYIDSGDPNSHFDH